MSPTKHIECKIEENKVVKPSESRKTMNLNLNCKEIQIEAQKHIGEGSTEDNSPSKISYDGYSPVRTLPNNFKKGEEP